MEEYYIISHQDENIRYLGPLKSSQADYDILKTELNIYNNFAGNLLSGIAPYPCYADPDTKDKIYRDGGHHLCGFFPYIIKNITDEVKEKGRSMSVDQFMYILSAPFDPTKQFSYGYGVLPGIREILMRQ